MNLPRFALCLIAGLSGCVPALADDARGLIGHWPLKGDARDASGHGRDGTAHGVDFSAPGPNGKPNGAARFDGRQAYIEVPAAKTPALGTQEFSLAVRVHTAEALDDVLGDIVSLYDPAIRRGFNFAVVHNVGATTSPANYRHVQFGIDNEQRESEWTDHGRLGNAVMIFSLQVHQGRLYASTCEEGADEAGRVFVYEDGDRWTDLGAPDKCNAITSLASYNGELYAAASQYGMTGSGLPPAQNLNPGGAIYRYAGDKQWMSCGQMPDVQCWASMAIFRGKLYASSMFYKPARLFRYEGGSQWTSIDLLDGKRVDAMCAFNGNLFATSYDGGLIYRYDGEKWTFCGALGQSTQTYSFAVLAGQLYVGSWPDAKVFRYEGDNNWLDVGTPGVERETMAAAIYNGQYYVGTLPLAQVYRYDGPENWFLTGRLDKTPDVKYRRAWTMAVFQGRLFCGTLPSGRVLSLAAGTNVTHDRELPHGWQHLAVVKGGGKLTLYVEGKPAATSSEFQAADYDLTVKRPLQIGFGRHDYFNGSLSDVRLYDRALTAAEVAGLAGKP